MIVPIKFNIAVFNRVNVVKFSQEDPYIVISINCPSDSPPDFEYDENRLGVQPIYINDVDDPVYAEKYGYRIMDKNQAENILNFVESFKDKVNTIIVHCDAGRCRSAGVAAALAKIYNIDDSLFWNNAAYKPSSHIYRLLLQTAIDLGIFDYDKRLKQIQEEREALG